MKRYNIFDSLTFMIKEAYKRHKIILVFCVLLVITQVFNYLIQLYTVPKIIAVLETTVNFWDLLRVICGFGIALFLVTALDGYINENTLYTRVDLRTYIIAQINTKVAKTSYINTLKTDFLDKREKAMETCSGNNRPAEAIWRTLVALLVDVILLVIYSVVISELGIFVIAVVTITSIVAYFIEARLTRWAIDNREIDQKNDNHLHYLRNVETDRSYAKDIRIFGMVKWLDDIWDGFLKTYEAFHAKKEKRYLLANVASVLLVLLQNIIVYGILLERVFRGDIDVATFLLYFNALSSLSLFATTFLKDASKLKRECVDIITILEVLNYPEPYRFADGAKTPEFKDITIELKDVSYRYPNADKEVLSHIDLTLHPHEKLAIVGVNGAGKTTLIKILCGLLDPTQGQVLLNGEDIRKYDRRLYYELFSTIFQDIEFFEESFRVNITNTMDSTDDEKIIWALKRAGLYDKIN